MPKAYLFLIDGFEETEAIAPLDVLRRVGVDTVTVSLEPTLDVVGGHQITVKADQLFSPDIIDDGDCFILPGGAIASDKWYVHDQIHSLLKQAYKENKMIAAICAATRTLGKIGLLQDKIATGYPGVEADLTGANCVSDPVVVSRNVITSRGPATSLAFGLTLARLLTSEEQSQQVAKAMLL